MGNLSAKTVEHAPRGKHSDGDGLSLVVKPSGARIWVVRVSVAGRKRDIGIGPWPTVGLAAARQRRDEIKAEAKAGRDPTTQRSDVPTFGQAAERVCDMMRPTWRDPRHGDIWLGRLRKYAAPLWHTRADQITRSDVLAVLHPIWHSKPEIARRIRQGIRKVLGWVMAHHEHMASNAAGEGIDAALPRTPKVANHQRAIHYVDVPAAMRRIEDSEASPASRLCLVHQLAGRAALVAADHPAGGAVHPAEPAQAVALEDPPHRRLGHPGARRQIHRAATCALAQPTHPLGDLVPALGAGPRERVPDTPPDQTIAREYPVPGGATAPPRHPPVSGLLRLLAGPAMTHDRATRPVRRR